MKKVLLVIHSPFNRKNFLNAMPPLGILYISSFLESKGIRCDAIDYNISKVDYSCVRDYDLVGFSVNCSNVSNTLKMAKEIKKTYGTEIVVGGPQVTGDPQFFLEKEYIDGAIIGEGEYALYEFIKNRKLVQGMYLKDEKRRVVFGGERPFINDLDSLPFPALDKVDITKYNMHIKKKKPVSAIITSRGCPFGCIFCFHPLGYAFRPRSAENVIEEIVWQVKNFGVRELCFQDDNISLDIVRAKKIFRGIIDRNLDVVFHLYGGIRVDRVDDELLGLMKKAKIWLISVSPESGDIESSRLMKKGFSKETVKKVVKMSKEMGFFTYANFMIGFPWETEEHIRRTIDFAVELDADVSHFTRVVAFPNTELYDMCNLDYRVEEDIGLFYSDPKFNISKLSVDKIDEFIRKAYRKCYLNPRKVVRILKNLRWRDIYELFKYSIVTKSI